MTQAHACGVLKGSLMILSKKNAMVDPATGGVLIQKSDEVQLLMKVLNRIDDLSKRISNIEALLKGCADG